MDKYTERKTDGKIACQTHKCTDTDTAKQIERQKNRLTNG